MSTRFNVCDLNAIETRVGAWLAGCADLLNVFQPLPGRPNGRCPYLDMATKLYGIPNEKLEADYKSKDPAVKGPVKRMRQISKPGILAAIYRQSGGGWGFSKKGYKDHTDECIASKQNKRFCACPTIYDKIKTGLWGYAAGMGIDMPQEQAVQVARVFREAYKEIPEFWFALENAVMDVMKGTQTVRRLGPGGCVVIDKLNITDNDGNIIRTIMRMQLPSGRYLHYIDARLEMVKMPWKNRDTGEDVYREALVYAGVNQDTKQWDTWTQTHGGKLFENLVQAIARDILATKLLEFESNDMPVCGHVHDEGICLVLNDPFSPGYKDMVRIMSTPVEWAPGLLLGADGFEDVIYHK